MKQRQIHQALQFSTLVAAAFVGSIAAASPTSNNTIVLKDVAFRGASGSALKLVKAGGGDAIAVEGAEAVIGLTKIIEKAAGKAAMTSCRFAVQAVDAKAHRFAFTLGKLGTINLTEGDGDAWLLPNLGGATSFGVQVFEKGKLVRTLAGQTKTLTLPDFATHKGGLESLELEVSYAKVANDAWSVSLTHGTTIVVLTPEGVIETTADAPREIGVQTTSLEGGFVLIDRGVTLRPI